MLEPRLEFPHVALFPATLWDRLAAKFSAKVVIQNGYRVVSQDSETLGSLDDQLSASIDGKMCLEVGEGFLLLYRRDKLVDPQDLEDFLRIGLRIYSQVSGPDSDTKSGLPSSEGSEGADFRLLKSEAVS